MLLCMYIYINIENIWLGLLRSQQEWEHLSFPAIPQHQHQQVNSGISIPALGLKITDMQLVVKLETVSKWDLESGGIIHKDLHSAIFLLQALLSWAGL